MPISVIKTPEITAIVKVGAVTTLIVPQRMNNTVVIGWVK